MSLTCRLHWGPGPAESITQAKICMQLHALFALQSLLFATRHVSNALSVCLCLHFHPL